MNCGSSLLFLYLVNSVALVVIVGEIQLLSRVFFYGICDCLRLAVCMFIN